MTTESPSQEQGRGGTVAHSILPTKGATQVLGVALMWATVLARIPIDLEEPCGIAGIVAACWTEWQRRRVTSACMGTVHSAAAKWPHIYFQCYATLLHSLLLVTFRHAERESACEPIAFTSNREGEYC